MGHYLRAARRGATRFRQVNSNGKRVQAYECCLGDPEQPAIPEKQRAQAERDVQRGCAIAQAGRGSPRYSNPREHGVALLYGIYPIDTMRAIGPHGGDGQAQYEAAAIREALPAVDP